MFVKIISKNGILNPALKQGLQALGPNSIKIELENTRNCKGSVDIDSHLCKLYPNENRWDYVIGYNDKAIFIEVHPAETSEVQVVIRKYQWLIQWLKKNIPQLKEIAEGYYWISTNGNHISKGSKQERLLAQSGIPQPISKLRVKLTIKGGT